MEHKKKRPSTDSRGGLHRGGHQVHQRAILKKRLRVARKVRRKKVANKKESEDSSKTTMMRYKISQVNIS